GVTSPDILLVPESHPAPDQPPAACVAGPRLRGYPRAGRSCATTRRGTAAATPGPWHCENRALAPPRPSPVGPCAAWFARSPAETRESARVPGWFQAWVMSVRCWRPPTG